MRTEESKQRRRAIARRWLVAVSMLAVIAVVARWLASLSGA
ncbi:Uncharacterised protein [Bordetella bronchiseptica]|nr:hypothetical protein L525_2806 [Bordetella bronchiseptica MBORD782]VTQ82396.1 Uncharacterised protein [Bordetella bronchiseptica]